MENNLQNTANNLKSKNLIFLTAEFPYGTGETFIENEFPFLVKSFDKIIIISNAPPTTNPRINADPKIEILYFPYNLTFSDKKKILQGLFTNVFWDEIKTIQKHYRLKLKLSLIKIVLSSLQKKKNIIYLGLNAN